MNEVRVRTGARADFGALLELWRAADAAPTVSDSADGLAKLLERDPQALLVAEGRDGRVVGSLIAGWNGWRGSFYRLAVDPAWRRRGIARALLAEGERRLAALGAARLDAIVIEGDESAERFWTAVGYEQQSERLRFVRTL